MQRYRKQYVRVDETFNERGQIIPKAIHWSDDRIFLIDSISDVILTAGEKAGGVGLRYTCSIRGQQRYLFMESLGKWFLEVPVESEEMN